jgi:hypothetical protein
LIVDDELPVLMGDAEFPVAVIDEAGRLTWMSSALGTLLQGGVAGPSEVRAAMISILRAAHGWRSWRPGSAAWIHVHRGRPLWNTPARGGV